MHYPMIWHLDHLFFRLQDQRLESNWKIEALRQKLKPLYSQLNPLLYVSLLLGDATTVICHRYTPREQLLFHVKHADILVVATGIPGLIHGDMLKPGCAIIDVGINRVKNPKTGKNMLVGDCDFESK